ncbi:hypothetical protein Ocin01_18317 [Orchesella cincta]|uniref:RNA-directed DNA polymerase n=1 Tax=Orchesella cincta TaxID=48709 RepID=A0A1D2M5W0_ORCCI|nr:hypothetical protein Ocin01_18317 [Orchesella cincta]
MEASPSRLTFCDPAEARYSASEIEMLAVVWAIKKCRLFLLGHPFELIVDHRPLIPIINCKTLDEIENPRLQRLKEKLSSFRPQAIWRAVPSIEFGTSEVSDPDKDDQIGQRHSIATFRYSSGPDNAAEPFVDPIINCVLNSLLEASELSSEYRRLRNHITSGFPEKHKLDEDLHPFWKVRYQLSLEGRLIFLGSRILVPSILRKSILNTLHSSHQGQERTLRRARQCVFWPGITNDIRNVVSSCKQCAAYLPAQQQEPLCRDPLPTFPFQTVGVDLFSHAGYEYLVMADHYSGWLNVAKCGTSANTNKVIFHLKHWMTDMGIPEKLMSDNGSVLLKWGIKHTTSSPHYPQSNGLAESAVKAVKYLLAKTSPSGDLENEAFQLGLLELRNTPRADGRSPAQMVFGQPMRTTLPLHRSRFAAEWKSQHKDCDIRASRLRQKATERYNKAAKPLKGLQRGDIVLLQDPKSKRWSTLGEIIDTTRRGRSHLVRTESGRVFRRNRRFLRTFTPTPTQAEQVPVVPESIAPRRSERIRSKPVRYLNVIQCDQRSHLQGGHEPYRPSLPCILLRSSASDEAMESTRELQRQERMDSRDSSRAHLETH